MFSLLLHDGAYAVIDVWQEENVAVSCLAGSTRGDFKKRSTCAARADPVFFPWPLGSGLSPSFVGWLTRIDEDRCLQLVRQEDQFRIRTVIQFVPKIG